MHHMTFGGLPLESLSAGRIRAFHPEHEDIAVEQVRSVFDEIEMLNAKGRLTITFVGDATLSGPIDLLTINLVSEECPFDGTGWVELFDDLRETALKVFEPVLIPIEQGKDARIDIVVHTTRKGTHCSDGYHAALTGRRRVLNDDD